MSRLLTLIVIAAGLAGGAHAKEICISGYHEDHGHCVADDRNVRIRPPSHMSASPGPVRAQCPPHNRMGPHGQCRPY
jgi:hypothetical protein